MKYIHHYDWPRRNENGWSAFTENTLRRLLDTKQWVEVEEDIPADLRLVEGL